MDLGQYKYAHIGNKEIKKEQFIHILNDYRKPFGGFWASPFNNIEGSISDRTDYILEEADEKFQAFDNNGGCLFNISKDAKVYNIICDNDVIEAKKKYGNGKEIDFELLSKDYDAVYVNPFSLSFKLRNDEFIYWVTRSLLIFNLDIIEEYVPIEFDFVRNKGFYITDVGEKENIKDVPTDFYHNQYLIKELFHKRMQKRINDLFLEKDNLEKIKFSLLREFRTILDEESFNTIEAIIINECTYQKKKKRKDSV